MTNGLKTDYGTKLGKTIILAKKHAHAEKILEIFGKAYPELPGYAKVIDNYTNYAQSAIDEFSEAKKLPQIAISVDMLDTGIDVQELVSSMVCKVQELNRENFAVRLHLKFVERFSAPENYVTLSYEDTLNMETELVPLILPDKDDARALRFDALMYGIELAILASKPYTRAKRDLLQKVRSIASVANIPEIQAQSGLIEKILHTDCLENAGISEFEYIRKCLRNLVKYIPRAGARYDTNFDDEILSMDWKDAELENDDLKNYKDKAAFYVRQHQDETVITKLRGNVPLTAEDVDALERILWSEVGTQQEYEAECGQKPLGEFVREIVGLDMNAAKMAFADYLNDTNLDSRQIFFVNQIVEYIVRNGMMKDLSVLQAAPFTDQGSVVEVFTDLSGWLGIRAVIDRINANALGT